MIILTEIVMIFDSVSGVCCTQESIIYALRDLSKDSDVRLNKPHVSY